ncbi:hypothetical protein AVEN_97975-1 [Araneus ventricosus]|uniref:Uncharacterized protein n=1 Tax=Araneus ventricosus TaxID=182803 RepID=A0A4Y2TJD2_ARAVE|nr:hypothetical protein AVEN_46519-1 [Araneus ventricosus]GBN99489.1 hypothetical protein AVEN_97975-1 [Araneus ventricosus]
MVNKAVRGLFSFTDGLGGLVVRSRLRDRRIPGSKPILLNIRLVCGPVARQSGRSGPNVLPLRGTEARRGGTSSGVVLVISPRFIIPPKMAVVLLQNWTLI